MSISIGTAGWAVGSAAAASFPESGSSLERYASVFDVAEINSSFHRPHRAATWQRWRDSVPDGFRFSVKVPRAISHERKLIDCDELVAAFLEQVHALGDKLAILLLQLPPKLAFEEPAAMAFLTMLRGRTGTTLVCEPRHASWFEPQAGALLRSLGVTRVAADPAKHPGADVPGGWRGLSYFRLHGWPVMYRSSYQDRIGELAATLEAEAAAGRPSWCIFDNTASSAAIGDALSLRSRIRR